jgi:hypothetical protein
VLRADIPRCSQVADVDFENSMLLERKTLDVTARSFVATVEHHQQLARNALVCRLLHRPVNAFQRSMN